MTEEAAAGVLFIVDAASFQGQVNWAQVDTTCAGGIEKFTQGLGYVNPYARQAKAAMGVRARASGFVPGGYLFLENGNGAAQADYFADFAGDMAGYGIVVDAEPMAGLERLTVRYPELAVAANLLGSVEEVKARTGVDVRAQATSWPAIATVRACAARLRQRYPGHPLGGYLPRWFWGSQDTTMFDWLWASNYVLGQAPPATLYGHVVAAQWAGYGGTNPALLQFTSSALVPGVAGPVDCSAYRGSGAGLAHLMLPTVTPPPAPAAPQEDDMTVLDLPADHTAVTVQVPAGKTVMLLSADPLAEVRVGWRPHWAGAKIIPVSWETSPVHVPLPAGVAVVTISRAPLDTGVCPVTAGWA
jgi:hypothetical protein